MRIYKDIIEELDMNSMFLTLKGQNFFCTPLDISGNIWTAAVDADFTIEGNSILTINRHEGQLHFPCYIDTVRTSEISAYSCIHRIMLSTGEFGENEMKFIHEVRRVESEIYKWNKRREERYDIKDDIEKIDFSSVQQQVILKEDTLPCMVNNISYGGAQIITYDARYEIGGRLLMNYSFRNPPEEILVPSYIRHIISQPAKEGCERLIVLCLEYDHAPLAFHKRMEAFIKKIEDAKLARDKK